MKINLTILFIFLWLVKSFSCPTITISSTDVNCYLDNNGTATATINGPNAPFTVTWSTGQSASISNEGTTSISNLPAGVYSLYVVDQLGCTSTHLVSVEEPSPVSGVVSNKNNVLCHGGSDGSIDLTPLGGTPNYTFNWSNGNTTEDPNGLSAGTYSVTISDANGCTSNSISAIIGEPATPLTSTIIGIDAKCFGESSGKIDLSPSGGTSPYTFSWNNGATSEDLNNVNAGSYNVTITDNNNCTATNTATINEPTQITSTITSTDVSCFNGSDGGIQLTPNGGTPPYNFKWANASSVLVTTTEDLTNIPSSTYYLTITDFNGCKHLANQFVTEPPLLETSLIPSHVLCYGESTGAILNNVIGGTAPYSFNWNNNLFTTKDLNAIPFGDYKVTITDANSCVLTDSIYISQPHEPLNSYYNIISPSCFGYDDGEIYYNVEGGTFPYDYLWSRGDTVLNLYEVIAGKYICTTTDDNGCVLSDTITVSQPNQLIIDSVVTDVSCFELSDGTIDVTVTGGTIGYDYSWTNSTYELSVNTQDLLNYPADIYIIQVVDSNACEAFKTIVISEPPLLEGALDITDVTCFGNNDGIIEAIITGGNIGGYTFPWNNGETTQIIGNLAPGTYEATVYDTKGCEVYVRGVVHEPDPIVINYEVFPLSCRDLHDAAIETAPTGGNGGFTFSWDYDNLIDANIYNLYSGQYIVTVTDILNCSLDSTITVPTNDNPCLTPPMAFTPEGDGYNDIWYLENIELYPECDVLIYNKWGRLVFESKGYSNPWDGNFNGKPLPADTYYYSIKIIDNAVYTGAVTIVR